MTKIKNDVQETAIETIVVVDGSEDSRTGEAAEFFREWDEARSYQEHSFTHEACEAPARDTR